MWKDRRIKFTLLLFIIDHSQIFWQLLPTTKLPQLPCFLPYSPAVVSTNSALLRNGLHQWGLLRHQSLHHRRQSHDSSRLIFGSIVMPYWRVMSLQKPKWRCSVSCKSSRSRGSTFTELLPRNCRLFWLHNFGSQQTCHNILLIYFFPLTSSFLFISRLLFFPFQHVLYFISFCSFSCSSPSIISYSDLSSILSSSLILRSLFPFFHLLLLLDLLLYRFFLRSFPYPPATSPVSWPSLQSTQILKILTSTEFAYPVPLFAIFKCHETILIDSNYDVI